MKKRLIILSLTLIVIITTTMAVLTNNTFGAPNYLDAMSKAITFYDANRCGEDVAVNNVYSWRSACHTSDGSEAGIDLTGGFHDAGDHVKFGLPAAFSASALGWSLYEFKSEYDAAGITNKSLSTLKIFSDFFIKSLAGNSFYYQVGDGGADHSYWGPPEEQTGNRPLRKGTPADVGGQTAGALAIMYLNYKSVDSTYANKCLTAAKDYFNLVKSSTQLSETGGFYNSGSYKDDLAWGAIWLYIATNDSSYLSQVDQWIANDSLNIEWTYCWDYVGLANILVMAKLDNNQEYKDAVAWNLKWYRDSVTKTPGGLPYLNNWAVLRYATAEAGIAYMYYKYFGDDTYLDMANDMVNYCLGDNPLGMNYLTNYGTKSPKHPHHRANEPVRGGTTNGLVGALVGGPNNNDQYTDDVNAYEYSEVALDYNAAFLLGCAGSSYVARGGQTTTVPSTAPTTITTTIPATTQITTVPNTTISTTTVPTTTAVSPSPSTTTSVQPSPSASVPASGKVTVDYKIANDWGSGATVNVTLNNNGSAINSWQLSFTFAGNQKITNMWNAKYTQSGTSVVVTNEAYNGSIPANGSVSFGFNISYSGSNSVPTDFIVN